MVFWLLLFDCAITKQVVAVDFLRRGDSIVQLCFLCFLPNCYYAIYTLEVVR